MATTGTTMFTCLLCGMLIAYASAATVDGYTSATCAGTAAMTFTVNTSYSTLVSATCAPQTGNYSVKYTCGTGSANDTMSFYNTATDCTGNVSAVPLTSALKTSLAAGTCIYGWTSSGTSVYIKFSAANAMTLPSCSTAGATTTPPPGRISGAQAGAPCTLLPALFTLGSVLVAYFS